MPVRDAWKAKPPSSNYQISMPDLFKAALDSIDVYKFANKDKPRIIAEKLYDALKNGHMRSWGQQSNFYPPSISHPRPAIKAITHSFWDNNTIEELEAAAGRHMIAQSAGWDSITLPDTSRFDRSKAECFWNLVFERDEVRRTFPRREGYY